ncbi:hypothetical protein HMN09_00933100 [Mycena chlorophos]|uniref:Glyoxal oxidase n=1 Tax=Mycena chlorophos TaxID=658473 RepID=A0A8H6SKF4_MYCCL|nr:hypothetical protein HMN09_00933100 [Mycena chlorophos]
MRLRLGLHDAAPSVSLSSLVALASFFAPGVSAAKAGTFDIVAHTQVSAMMMFLGNTDKVYILDKAQGNAAQINGHSAWGSVYDLNTNTVTLMDIQTNTFCSSGSHLPNGTFSVFGGNSAVAIGGGNGNDNGWDSVLQDFDGSRAIRLLSPCTTNEDFTQPECQWFDQPGNTALQIQDQRWYSSAEALADGTIVLLGGFTGGGYILRNYPNTNPFAGASLTYEYYPNTVKMTPQNVSFLVETSGLNAYPHMFLMASGKMFVQANVSTILWDVQNNLETPLPPMPHNVVRVYPASGATAMLPMTPANNWTQTIIFCGGSNMTDEEWGDFAYPFVNTWDVPASNDCQMITPEGDGVYHQLDDMPEGRTMGQFIILPTGKLLVVNGGLNGTAGYGRNNSITPPDEMPFQESFASGPVGTPAMFDPQASSGSQWTNEGFDTSPIARLYHSSALLLPDGGVLIAGSNPNLDVNTTAVTFGTEYRAEKFYPPYFSAATRPAPQGVPSNLTYGGPSFDITIPASSYAGSGNTAAESAQVNVIRPGWTTHGMNMGQRFLQLNNTYTVNSDSSITLHVAQMPPNANIFQPGPAFIFVVVNDIPSNATYAIVGSGQIEPQTISAIAELPVSVQLNSATGSGSNAGTDTKTSSGTTTSHLGLIIGVAAGGAALALLALGVGICITRRRNAKRRAAIAASRVANMNAAGIMGAGSSPYASVPTRTPESQSQVFLPQGHRQNQGSDWGSVAGTDTDSAIWEAHAQTHAPAMSGFRQQPYRDEPQQYQQQHYQQQQYQQQQYQPGY